MDQAAGERHRDRLGAVGDAQFGEDVLEMDPDRLVHPTGKFKSGKSTLTATYSA